MTGSVVSVVGLVFRGALEECASGRALADSLWQGLLQALQPAAMRWWSCQPEGLTADRNHPAGTAGGGSQPAADLDRTQLADGRLLLPLRAGDVTLAIIDMQLDPAADPEGLDALDGWCAAAGQFLLRDTTEGRWHDTPLRELLHAGRIYVFKWTRDSGLIRRSESSLEILGADAGGAHGQPADDFLQRLPTEDRDRFTATLEALTPNDPDYRITFRYRRTDGSVVWLEERGCAIFDQQQEAVAVRGMAIDVTERIHREEALRRSRERLRLALQAGRMGTWDWDIESGRVEWSPTLERLHGLAPGSFGGSFDDFQADIHPDDRQRVADRIRRVLESDQTDYDIDYRIVPPNHLPHRCVEARGRVIRAPSGKPVRMLGVCMDVTERVQAERALREANRQKNDFLAMLGHELRNPLAAIQAAADLLQQDAVGEPARVRAHGVLQRQAHHMARLLDDLLDVSRVTNGKLNIEHQPVDLGALVKQAVNEHRQYAAAEGIDLVLEAEPAPAAVEGDPVRLTQVLDNLIGNAIKYTPPPGVVRVQLSGDDHAIRLDVVDTGVGIAAEFVERMFEPFTQEPQDLARARGGLGLGLPLSRGIAELHGGTLSVSSKGRGRGSCFSLRLPRLATIDSGADSQPAPATAALRIVIIEDREDAAQMLAQLLESLGHEVSIGYDGNEGLALVRRLRPDVVLCDLGLPGLSGYEVARRLRTDPVLRDCRLLALSGYSQPADQEQSMAAGFDAHLVKPLSLAALQQALGAAQPATSDPASATTAAD